MATKAATKKSTSIRKVKVQPLGEHVLVERTKAEEVTRGGIVLPESAKEKPREGVVIAVGEGRLSDDGKRVPPQVKPGDRVIFASYAGSEVKLGTDKYLIVREEEILAVVN